jgi:hypothetical protein
VNFSGLHFSLFDLDLVYESELDDKSRDDTQQKEILEEAAKRRSISCRGSRPATWGF